jgi:hypothetical protein
LFPPAPEGANAQDSPYHEHSQQTRDSVASKKRKFKETIRFEAPLSDRANLLARQFAVSVPNAAWVNEVKAGVGAARDVEEGGTHDDEFEQVLLDI